MTRRLTIIIAIIGSTSILAAAFAFQFMGYSPCKICIWQRWPHVVAVFTGVVWLIYHDSRLLLLGLLSTITASSLAIYHSGIEQKWWLGPQSCTSSGIGGLSTDELFSKIMNAPIVRCDEIVRSFLGFSMANWNVFLSFILTLFWLYSIKHNQKT